MTRFGMLVVLGAIVLVGLIGWYAFGRTGTQVAPAEQATTTPTTSVTPPQPASKDDLIVVDAPLPNAVVGSPLTVTGKARGSWYFEAQFPVKLYDATGKLIASAPAHASGDWMTTEYVPFSVTLTFASSNTSTGKLVLEKDNPSGLPQNANSLEIPVSFLSSQSGQTTVKLYYYNPLLDQGPGGAQCSSKGLVAVERNIPKTSTPLTDAIQLLLKGELTDAERAQGLTTEFPLPDVSLTNASITSGVATLTFADPQHKLSGGSCRTSILWKEIEATAKQFPTVSSVRYHPATLFQP
ncbi:MAG: Gmad2 immunoglobulin-like domain-containing protein [Bacillota bacterium]